MAWIKKRAFLILMLVLLLFSINPLHTSKAQRTLSLEEIYPQQASLGEEFYILLRGQGFESINDLNAVLLYGEEIPVLDFNPITDELIEIQLVIPQDFPSGETEIRFILDDFALDAFFIINEDVELENKPQIIQMEPREGRPGNEVSLFVEFDRPLDSAFGGVVIEDVEVTVLDFEANDSGELWQMQLFLPPETPVGESEIHLFYEDHSFSEFFVVRGTETEARRPPVVFGIRPNEGEIDTSTEIFIEGENLPELGELVGLTIAGIDVPIDYYYSDDNEPAAVGMYLPPELPPGDNVIVFYYEQYTIEEIFFVIAPEIFPEDTGQPELYNISPRNADLGSDIELVLEGENLNELGDLLGVTISGFIIPFTDYDVQPDDIVVIYAYVPEEAPSGSQTISVTFENAGIQQDFSISSPDTPRDFPTWITVIIGVLSLAGIVFIIRGGITLIRNIRGHTSSKKFDDEYLRKKNAALYFNVGLDFGEQRVETHGPRLTKNTDENTAPPAQPGEQNTKPTGRR